MLKDSMEPELSIIICTHNRADLLRKTLDSLLLLEDIEVVEVIVVDNQSSDHTEAVIDQYLLQNEGKLIVHSLFERVLGLSAARNAGIRASSAKLVAFLDDDAIPTRQWVRVILDTFEQMPEVMAMGGQIAPRFETKRPPWLIKPFELPLTIIDLGKRVREYPVNLHPFGANMALRKSVFEAILFPLDLGRKGNMLLSGEESWVFHKLSKEGQKVLYHPNMSVEHFIPANRLTREWMTQRYYYQGISNGNARKGRLDKLKLVGTLSAKVLYILVNALLARSEGSKLLIRCRLESIRGSLTTLNARK
jgi:glycosyltransferase involved in cell wall biosynthesis